MKKLKSILGVTIFFSFSTSLTAQAVRQVISTPNAQHSIVRLNNVALMDDEKKPFTGVFIVLNEAKEKMSEHHYVNGKLEGSYKVWRKYGSDPIYIETDAFYKNDKLHGHYTEWADQTMKRKECDYVNGEFNGKWISYSGKKEDEVAVIRFYKMGKSDSTHTWFENGKTQRIERYKNGKEHGLFQEFYPDGKIKLEIDYKDNSKNGVERAYYSNGQLAKVTNYVNGKRNGEEIEYYESGKVEVKRYFKMDDKAGKWTWYNEDGSVKEESTYQQ